MSGGSLDYVYRRLEEIAERISGSPLHDAFREHVLSVAKALHDVEWVYSNDYSEGDEEAAIRAVIHPGAELAEATKRAERALADLQAALENAHRREA